MQIWLVDSTARCGSRLENLRRKQDVNNFQTPTTHRTPNLNAWGSGFVVTWQKEQWAKSGPTHLQTHHVMALICIIWQCHPHPIMLSDIISSDLWEVGRNVDLAYISPVCFRSAYKASTCPLKTYSCWHGVKSLFLSEKHRLNVYLWPVRMICREWQGFCVWLPELKRANSSVSCSVKTTFITW